MQESWESTAVQIYEHRLPKMVFKRKERTNADRLESVRGDQPPVYCILARLAREHVVLKSQWDSFGSTFNFAMVQT